MSYEQFCEKYQNTFDNMMKYHPNEVGALVFAEKLATLAEKYPQYLADLEKELTF